jgi:hypothetical protein
MTSPGMADCEEMETERNSETIEPEDEDSDSEKSKDSDNEEEEERRIAELQKEVTLLLT